MASCTMSQYFVIYTLRWILKASDLGLLKVVDLFIHKTNTDQESFPFPCLDNSWIEVPQANKESKQKHFPRIIPFLCLSSFPFSCLGL